MFFRFSCGFLMVVVWVILVFKNVFDMVFIRFSYGFRMVIDPPTPTGGAGGVGCRMVYYGFRVFFYMVFVWLFLSLISDPPHTTGGGAHTRPTPHHRGGGPGDHTIVRFSLGFQIVFIQFC